MTFKAPSARCCDFLQVLFAGVAHTVGNEKRVAGAALPGDLGADCGTFSCRPSAAIHTRLRFQNRKIGGVNLAHEKHLGGATISVERCVLVTGAAPASCRLGCALRAEVQP